MLKPLKLNINNSPGRTGALIVAGIIFAAYFLVYLAGIIYPGPMVRVNNILNDTLFKIRRWISGKEPVSPRLVHLVMDDATYSTLDIPAWDRSLYSRIIDIVTRAEARTIACDLFFKDRGLPDKDAKLVLAVKKSGNVILPVIFYPETVHPLMSDQVIPGEAEDAYPEPATGIKGISGINIPADSRASFPFDKLARVVEKWGHINIEPDEDGVYRRVSLFYKYREGYIPAMALRIILDYYNIPFEELRLTKQGRLSFRGTGKGGKAGNFSIPIDKTGSVLLNYPGPWRESFYTYSVRHLLMAENNLALAHELDEELEGSIVIISDISTGNKDFGPAVFDKIYPLSGIHLTLANMILTENFLYEQNIFHSLLISLILAGILWSGIILFKSSGFFTATVINIFILTVYALVSFLVFNTVSLTGQSLAGFILSLLFAGIYLYMAEERKTVQQGIPATDMKIITKPRGVPDTGALSKPRDSINKQSNGPVNQPVNKLKIKKKPGPG